MSIVDAQSLRAFMASAFRRGRVNQTDAEIAADVLVAADLRGVESHGVARLHHYIAHLRDGVIVPKACLSVVREAPTTVAFDAGRRLGMVAAYRAMEACIERAAERFRAGRDRARQQSFRHRRLPYRRLPRHRRVQGGYGCAGADPARLHPSPASSACSCRARRSIYRHSSVPARASRCTPMSSLRSAQSRAS